jgi:hypothetical protein
MTVEFEHLEGEAPNGNDLTFLGKTAQGGHQETPERLVVPLRPLEVDALFDIVTVE